MGTTNTKINQHYIKLLKKTDFHFSR